MASDPHASPLRYPGGKQALAPLLAKLLVDNDLHDGTLVEPFAGGAGASLRLLYQEFASDLVLNDADPRIYAFWRAVLNQTEELVALVKKTSITPAKWKLCRDVYESPIRNVRQLELAFAVFFLNRCSRSGILMGSGPIGGYKQSGPWKIDARFNRKTLIARIRRVAEYRDRIHVSKQDAIDLLKNLKVDNSKTLVFLDPPYFAKGQRLYLNSLSPQYHQELAKFLLKDPPFYWVLTYDNSPQIRELYRSLSPRPFSLSYSVTRRRSGRELLIVDPKLVLSDELVHEEKIMSWSMR